MTLEFCDKTCKHERLTDYVNGCEVCILCGLVLEEQVFSSYNTLTRQPILHAQDNTHGELTTYQYNEVLQTGLNLIDDVCANYNISNHVSNMSKRLLMEKRQQITNAKMRIIAAMCFLKASQQFNSIRTKAEICSMFHILPKDLHTITNKCDLSKTQIDMTKPSDILPRVCFPFTLPYTSQIEIAERADNLFKTVNASPAAVLAFSIYTYFNASPYYTKLSMLQCAKLCNVSSTSIKRLCKK